MLRILLQLYRTKRLFALTIFAAALLLALVAILRVLAWLFHGAALAPQMIAVEVIVACLLLFTSSRLARGE